MKPKEKRKLERKTIQSRRRIEIIQAAKYVFHQKGIDNTAMTDVAAKAEVGVASVYRYFNTKAELVVETGIYYCRENFSDVKLPEDYDRKKGIEKVADIMDWMIGLYHKNPEFIEFLQQFDFFFKNNENRHPRISEFEDEISQIFPILLGAINDGISDGSIREDAGSLDMLALIYRTFVSLQQRFLTRDYILQIDEKLNRDDQLDILKDMFLYYLSSNR